MRQKIDPTRLGLIVTLHSASKTKKRRMSSSESCNDVLEIDPATANRKKPYRFDVAKDVDLSLDVEDY
jgi:hypothetical protein